MKIDRKRFPVTWKSCLLMFFFACMFVSASFTREDRERVREFKKDLMSKLTDKKEVDSFKEVSDEKSSKKSLATNTRKNLSQDILSKNNPFQTENENVLLPEINNEISTNAASYSSREKEGTIGTFSDKEEDRISDNFFTIDVPVVNKENTFAYLEYDLFGLASHQSVSRSINHNVAIGGEVIMPSAQWSHQREAISAGLIKNGINTILFTSPSEGVKYKVKNLKIVFDKDKKTYNNIIVSSILSGDKLYVKGNNINTAGAAINNEHVSIKNGEFEKLIQLSENDKAKNSFSVTANGITTHYKLPAETSSFKTVNNNYFNIKEISVSKDQELSIDYEGSNIKVEKETSESAYLEILKLRAKDFPVTSQGLKNVTPNNAAFRLSLISGQLNKKVKLTIPYDEKRLGLISPKDIKIFHFDYSKRKWVMDKSTIVDTKTRTVTVEGDGNTDYISGIISTPESPQLNAFAPTSISGLKAVDPMSGIQLMTPPTASQKGDANLSYPIKVPAGLGGLQPSLSIGYNSGGGNSWMGEGWDIQGVSAITIDTRWGTPQFNGATETELYSLDGEMLVYPNGYLPHRHNDISETNTAITTDKQPRVSYTTNGIKQFYLRKNHDFSIIERIGTDPTNYSWKITSTDGTKSYYGGDAASVIRNSNNQIVHWGLRMVEDSHGNTMEYTYQNTSVSLGNTNNLTGGTYFHIRKIAYGKNKDYTVNFNTETGITRKDVSINAKQTVKRVEPYLLKSVHVSYKTDTIRTYKMEYEDGQFLKTRLKRIYKRPSSIKDPVLDDYLLEYYDDVTDPQGNVNIFGPSTYVNVDHAPNVYGIVQGAVNPSKINGNTAYEWGINTRPAVGLNLFYPSNDAYGHVMFGVPFGFSNTEAKNAQQLIDFNGDGIQDMIYRVPDQGLYYSEGALSSSGELSFLPLKPILNFNSNFTFSKTKTSNWGFDMGLTVYSKSTINSKSSTTTSTYLADGNSDGLLDIVHNGEVWFNKYNSQGSPEMTKHSEYTENMIVKAKAVAPPVNIKTTPIMDDDPEPMIDVVKVWIAPKDGFIRFTDEVSLGSLPANPPVPPKAVYSVEILDPDNNLKHTRIYINEFTTTNSYQNIVINNYNDYYSQIQALLPIDNLTHHLASSNTGRLFVKSGEKVYVRLHKNRDLNLEVSSNPKITYVDAAGTEIINSFEYAQGQFHVNNGSYNDNFLLNNTIAPVYLDATGTAVITVAPITFPYTTDDFTFKIIKEDLNANTSTVLYSKLYPQSDVSFTTDGVGISSVLEVVVNTGQPINLKFIVESDSQTDFSTNWNSAIKVQYSGTSNIGPVSNNFFAIPEYPSYAITQFLPKTDIKNPMVNNNIITGIHDFKVQIKKNVTNYSTLGVGAFYYVIKKGNTVLAKRKVTIDNTNSFIEETDMSTGLVVSGISPVPFYTGDISQGGAINNHLINIQVYCNTAEDYVLYNKFSTYFTNKPFDIYYDSGNTYLTSVIHTSVNSAGYNSKSKIYNNWGQFLYNQTQDISNIAGIADNFGKLISITAFKESSTTQQLYPQCQNITDLNAQYQCIYNNTPVSNNGTTASGDPVTAMRTNVMQNGRIRNYYWIGSSPNQFASAYSFKDDDTSNYLSTSPIADPPATAPTTMTSGQISIDTTMKAIDKKQSSQSRNKTDGGNLVVANVANSVTELTGFGSVELQSFMDLNGDGYPDIVYPESVQLTASTGGLQDQQNISGAQSLAAGDVITHSFSAQKVNSLGFSYSGFAAIARGNVFGMSNTTTQADTSMSWSGDVSVGQSNYYDSTDYGQKFWIDVNGDGLPDRVEGGSLDNKQFRLNLGNTLAAGQSFENLMSYKSHPVGAQSISIGGGLGNTVNMQGLGNFGFGFSAGIGATSSIGSADVTYEDINGDGLTDILEVNNTSHTTTVRYNLGNKFDVAKPLRRTVSEVDFTNETRSYNGSLSFGGNVMINIGPIIIVPPFPVLYLYIKAGLGANANFGINVSDVKKAFKDMNGDGFVDLVEDSSGNGFNVSYSKIGRTNKLKSVTNRLTQGKYTIDYQFTKPNYQDPHAKLVVKEVRVVNPDVFTANYTVSDDTKDMITRYKFEKSRYDRRERDNFGFETVTREEMSGVNTVYRKTVDTYYNNGYLLGGTIKKSQAFKGDGTQISEASYSYKMYKLKNNTTQIDFATVLPDTYDTGGKEGRKMAVILLDKKTSTKFENGGQLQSIEQMSYNDKGLVTKFQYISPTNQYNSVITYWTGLNNNIISLPKQIDVYAGATSGTLLRQRKALSPNPITGDIGQIVIFDGMNDIPTDYTYDAYGNVASVQYPPNENNQKYALYYQYDALTGKYVTHVSDSFGYSSSAEYLPLFDVVTKSTDITGNVMQYTYDGHARVTTLTGPYEIGNPEPTVRYLYSVDHFGIPNSNQTIKIFRATTKTYDPENAAQANFIETDTYSDYLGRIVQVKKDIEKDGIEQRSVSGRTIYDVLGRGVKQYHPVSESIGNQNLNLTMSSYFTETTYDESDRVITAKDEDGNIKTTGFAIDGGYLKTTEQFLTMKTETFVDAQGKIVKKNDDLSGTPLTTYFGYNEAGDLLSTTDPEGIETTYEYNLAGRRTKQKHPDKGESTYDYDPAGHLIRLRTENLINDPTLSTNNIHYVYDYNRLTDIVLPDLPNGSNPNNVHYEYAVAGSGNATGKIAVKNDGTGQTIYTYGKLGEVIGENRTVFGYNIPTMYFNTTFSYDTWNRIKQINYPDGEIVYYKYDLGGNLKSVINNDNYQYITGIKYDQYGQRTNLDFGNTTKSRFNYYPTSRRLNGFVLSNQPGGSGPTYNILSNGYSYDGIGNITHLENYATVSSNQMGGEYRFDFRYDTLNRLTGSEGSFRFIFDRQTQQTYPGWSPYPVSNATYYLEMDYKDSGSISRKLQKHEQDLVANPLTSYENHYDYDKHKVMNISDSNTGNTTGFEYDYNGNVVAESNANGANRMYWDEQDRLKAYYDDNSGVYQYYVYDDGGDRTIKYNLSAGSQLYQNGTLIDPGAMSLNDYKVYPNAYVVVTSDGRYTKHYFEGSTRFASRVMDGSDIFHNPTTKLSTKNADAKEPDTEGDFKAYLEKAGLAGNISLELENKGPGGSGQPGLYYLHTDHLGTANYVTDEKGETTQFFLNLPFGETMAEQETGIYNNPYKFNAKELDSETGFYYYGARYYNPKWSLWYGVDPLAGKYPSLSPYIYVANNPINAIDPDGRVIIFINGQHGGDGGNRKYWNGLDQRVADRFRDYQGYYYDGALGGWKNTLFATKGVNLSWSNRMKAGMEMGYSEAAKIYGNLKDGETIKVATHSMGGAYGKGFVKGLKKYAKENGLDSRIERVLDLATFQGSSLEAEKGILTEQIAHSLDGVAGVSRQEGLSKENFHEARSDVKRYSLMGLGEHSVDSFTPEEINKLVKQGNPDTSQSSKDKKIHVQYEQNK